MSAHGLRYIATKIKHKQEDIITKSKKMEAMPRLDVERVFRENRITTKKDKNVGRLNAVLML